MSLFEINWRPTTRQLRQFAGICLVALPLLGWLWGGGSTVIVSLAGVGLGIALVGWLLPAALRPPFVALSIAATPVGVVIGEAALLLVFYGVFLPIGLVFRLMGRDVLQRKFDRNAETYFQPKQQPRDAARYYRQS